MSYGIPWPFVRPTTPQSVVQRVVAVNVQQEPKPAKDARKMRRCERCGCHYSIGAEEPDSDCSDHRPFGSPSSTAAETGKPPPPRSHTGLDPIGET